MGKREFRSEEEVTNILEHGRALTENFTRLDEQTYRAFPKLLFLIRLGCGMPQRKFAKTLGIDRSTLEHCELGISRKLEPRTIKKTFFKVKELFEKADFSQKKVLSSYFASINQAQHGQSAEKLREYRSKATKGRMATETEKIVERALRELDIEYEFEGTIKLDGLPYSFEFVVPNSNAPSAVIECKAATSVNSMNFRVLSYKIAYEIGYKGQLLKKEYPATKFVFVFFSELTKLSDRPKQIMESESIFLHNPAPKEIKKIFESLF